MNAQSRGDKEAGSGLGMDLDALLPDQYRPLEKMPYDDVL
jgi:hypothetical protein